MCQYHCTIDDDARVAPQVTYNDEHTQGNPSFQCEECYKALHYDKGGNLIYSTFKVFDYVHE